MLNSEESVIYTRTLLEDPAVYGYSDVYETEEQTVGEGEEAGIIEVETLLSSASDQMDSDIEACAKEVLYSEMLDVMSEKVYADIQAKPFDQYGRNDIRLFFAECYFAAYLFLRKYAVKNESAMFKTQIDFTGGFKASEKSGKLQAAQEYYNQAIKFLSDIDRESPVNPQGKAISIRRY